MRRTARLLPLLALHFAVLGCSDVAGPPGRTAQNLDVFIPDLALATERLPTADVPALVNEPGEDDAVPEAFDEMPAILRSRVTAGFTKTRAYAQAMMEFWGNRGLQVAHLDLRYNDAPVGSKSATGRKTEILPGIYRIDTTASIAINDECGHLADATSEHEAWHEYGTWNWDRETAENGDDAAQPICQKEQQVVQGGNDPNAQDDTGWYICYYTLYFDAEGNYLYTKFNGCEPL